MNHESRDRLTAAAKALRETPAHPDAVLRGERAVLAKIGRHRGSNRPVLLWAAGFAATAAVVGLFALAPARASAAELLRIAQRGDTALRHVRTFRVESDGTKKLTRDLYAQDGRRRYLFDDGEQIAYDGGSLLRLYPDGAVTKETQPSDGSLAPAIERSAWAVVNEELEEQAARLAVRHGVASGDALVDRYTIDADLAQPDGGSIHRRTTIDADPGTERPLQMRLQENGAPDFLTLWDYPTPNPALFHLAAPKGAPFFDIDAERASVVRSVRKDGRKATVRGTTVELLGLWVDHFGIAYAVARADYPYTDDYGLQIEGVASETPEKPPFSGQYLIKDPNEGYQLFGMHRATRGPLNLPNRVTVRLPVSRGQTFLGYATFANVPVNRAYEAGYLLRGNSERPFWTKGRPEIASPTVAVPEVKAARP